MYNYNIEKDMNYNIKILFVLLICMSSIGFSQNTQVQQRMLKEYEKIQQNQIPATTEKAMIQDDDLSISNESTIIPFGISDVEELVIDSTLKYFGYKFFQLRDEVIFMENLPTPKSYLLGPGDALVISIWGETELRQKYVISKDGKIYDARVGLLNPATKTIEEARKYLKNQFARVYATLKGNNPTSFMDVSLGELKSINVNFVGEVKYPGIYAIHPFSTILTGLIKAGGVDTTGSLRNIQIKRGENIVNNFDLYDYLIEGNLSNDIQLRDQDIVIIPVRESTVIVDSAVVRPGIYEAKPTETVKQMILYAGGPKATASGTVGLKRIIPYEQRIDKSQSTENYYIKFSNSALTTVQNGDVITIRSLFKTISQVEIIGQVKTPGVYYFKEGMVFGDLINLGGGFSDTTFVKSINLNRGELVRRNPNSRYEDIIPIDLRNLQNNNELLSLKLQNLDRLIIHANQNYFEKETIKILGEVNTPGAYPQIKDDESLQSFIDRAGGFTSKAYSEGIEIFRDTIRVAWENTNIPLSPGDSVVIKERPGVVFVSGEVYNAGFVEYQKGKKLKYYLDTVGGITPNGDKNDVIVIYANGVVEPKKFLNTPKVKDGSTIIVNLKEMEEPFNPTEFASTLASFLSSIVTIIVLSKQINS